MGDAGSRADTGLWDEVLGQRTAAAILRAAVDCDEVAHAWLFVGPAGVGQREAARALAADLNCQTTGSGGRTRACGACSACRRVRAGSHPACQEFVPEGASHVVGTVRGEWIPTATRTLTEGRRQVLRVVAADRMNEAAQNAFLKVLEEPPASVVWVLDVEDDDALLETVISRCRRVDFVPWTPGAMRAHAERRGVAEERREAIVRAAMGSPQRLDDLTDPDVAEARENHLGLLGRLAEEGPGVVVPAAAELDTWAKKRRKVRGDANREELDRLEEAFGGEWPPGVKGRLRTRFDRLEREERQRALELFLDDLGSYLRDVLFVSRGGDPQRAINADHTDQLVRDADRVPARVAVDGLRAIADCRDALARNGQPKLQLERLLLRLAVPIYTVGVAG